MENLNITVNMENLTKEERVQLLNLAKKGNKAKHKVWKPERDERYYALAGNGYIMNNYWENDDNDKKIYVLGNCFKTEEEAEFALEKRKVEVELQRFADEHNGEIDWNDVRTKKYYIFCHNCTKTLRVDWCTVYKDKNIFFSSQKLAEQAVRTIGEGRLKKYYFEV